jgi:hypothetical protein
MRQEAGGPDAAWAHRRGQEALVKAMGLKDPPLFEIHQVAVFEIDHERWLQGYLPTNNYHNAVTIYWVMTTDLSSSE